MNKKSVLLMICGLPRTFKKTAPDIFESLIKPNEESCRFTTIISTDFSFHPTGYFNSQSASSEAEFSYDDIEKLKLDLGVVYRKFGLKNILNLIYDKKMKHWVYAYRIHQILRHEIDIHYDYYVYLRPDVKVVSHDFSYGETAPLGKIKLNNYDNKFSIISRDTPHHRKRRCASFKNRDWDLIWVGGEIPFKAWFKLFLKFSGLNLDTSELNLGDNINLIENVSCQLEYNKAIKNKMIECGYEFEFSSDINLFSQIVKE